MESFFCSDLDPPEVEVELEERVETSGLSALALVAASLLEEAAEGEIIIIDDVVSEVSAFGDALGAEPASLAGATVVIVVDGSGGAEPTGDEVLIVKARAPLGTLPQKPRVGVTTWAPASPRYFRSCWEEGDVVDGVAAAAIVVEVVRATGGKRGEEVGAFSPSSSSSASPVRFNVGGGRFGEGKDSFA